MIGLLGTIKRKLKSSVCYILLYLAAAALIVVAFEKIYKYMGVDNSFPASVYIFLGIGCDEVKVLCPRLFIAQVISRDIVFSGMVLGVLSKFLRPSNPIFFSKYIVDDGDKLTIRYWIFLGRKKYLYDLNVRVFLTDGRLYNDGHGKFNNIWSAEYSYKLVQGVNYIDIEDKKEFIKKLKELLGKSQVKSSESHEPTDSPTPSTTPPSVEPSNKGPRLTVLIKGTNEDGLTFSEKKEYVIEESLFIGAKFVSVLKDERIKSAKDFGYSCASVNRPNTCYQYFNKMNKSKEYDSLSQLNIDHSFEEGKKDCLSSTQLVKGQYGILLQPIMDFFDRIIAHFYPT